MKTDLRYRSLVTEFNVAEDSRTIHGLAIPVNSRSAFIHDFEGDYYEIILPSAVNDDLIRNNDVKIYLDHDFSQGTYARSKYGEGSLKLEVTERGLEFEFDAPTTVFGDALLEGIRRGDYDAVSFGFIANDEKWTYDDNGEPLHYIMSFKRLAEISILSLAPAFPVTEVELRSLDEFKKEQERKYNESIAALDEATDKLNDLYTKYLDIAF